MQPTHEQYGSMQEYGSGHRRGHEGTGMDYTRPEEYGRGYRWRRRERRGGIVRRMAHWIGATLQDWADMSAERISRAGDRARELAERGGREGEEWMERGERRGRRWARRAGGRLEAGGREMAGYGREMRERSMRGPYAGRGPRGYRRSDERIYEEVCDTLARGFIDAGDIEVAVENGEVILRGEVKRREWKRMAEDEIEDVDGVRDVRNELRVREQAERGEKRGEPSFHSGAQAEPHH